jgi:hypothetical protein
MFFPARMKDYKLGFIWMQCKFIGPKPRSNFNKFMVGCVNKEIYIFVTIESIWRDVARPIIVGGGCIFIYSCSARRISFESDCFYGIVNMNIRIYNPPPPPQLSRLATALYICVICE